MHRHWKLLVPERHGVCIEDMDIFQSVIVLYERHNGQPSISVLPLQQGRLQLLLRCLMMKVGCPALTQFCLYAGPQYVHQLREIDLPESVTELTPCANPDFHAKEIAVRISSPIMQEATLQVNLQEPFSHQVLTPGELLFQRLLARPCILPSCVAIRKSKIPGNSSLDH